MLGYSQCAEKTPLSNTTKCKSVCILRSLCSGAGSRVTVHYKELGMLQWAAHQTLSPRCGLMDGLTPSNCRLLPKPVSVLLLPAPTLLLVQQLSSWAARAHGSMNHMSNQSQYKEREMWFSTRKRSLSLQLPLLSWSGFGTMGSVKLLISSAPGLSHCDWAS